MSRHTFVFEAHAKVNLCLAVHYPPQEGGYHLLDSVFQELGLHDSLIVSVQDSASYNPVRTKRGTAVMLDCPVAGLAGEDNLIFRALDLAEQLCAIPATDSGKMLCIEVKKRIPAGGGLGGGSSDAAAMLKAYAQLAGLDPLDARLLHAARQLGADVAFFLYGGAALMRGRGDVLDRRLPPLRLPIVLMGDDTGMSTAAIYRAFDENPPAVPDADELAKAMESADIDMLRAAALCSNNLGPAACEQNERLRNRIEKARAHPDVLNALVSGSGSTSFAICRDSKAASRFARDIAPDCAWVETC